MPDNNQNDGTVSPAVLAQLFDCDESMIRYLAKKGIVAGAPLARWFPEHPKAKGALLCVATELHSPELIDLFAKAVAP